MSGPDDEDDLTPDERSILDNAIARGVVDATGASWVAGVDRAAGPDETAVTINHARFLRDVPRLPDLADADLADAERRTMALVDEELRRRFAQVRVVDGEPDELARRLAGSSMVSIHEVRAGASQVDSEIQRRVAGLCGPGPVRLVEDVADAPPGTNVISVDMLRSIVRDIEREVIWGRPPEPRRIDQTLTFRFDERAPSRMPELPYLPADDAELPRCDGRNLDAMAREQGLLRAPTDADGGYLVPPEISGPLREATFRGVPIRYRPPEPPDRCDCPACAIPWPDPIRAADPDSVAERSIDATCTPWELADAPPARARRTALPWDEFLRQSAALIDEQERRGE